MTIVNQSLDYQTGNPLIIIEPRGAFWVVRSARRRNGATFKSAWQAEEAARKLGRKFADKGVATDIQLFIRGGEYVGSLSYRPQIGLVG